MNNTNKALKKYLDENIDKTETDFNSELMFDSKLK